jgi:hypothetical protein
MKHTTNLVIDIKVPINHSKEKDHQDMTGLNSKRKSSGDTSSSADMSEYPHKHLE